MTLAAARTAADNARYTLSVLKATCPDLLDDNRAAHEAAIDAAYATFCAAMDALRAERARLDAVNREVTSRMNTCVSYYNGW